MVPRRRDAAVADCDNEEKSEGDDEWPLEVFVLGCVKPASPLFVSSVPASAPDVCLRDWYGEQQ